MIYRHTLGLVLNPAELNPDPTFTSPHGGGIWFCQGDLDGTVTSSYVLGAKVYFELSENSVGADGTIYSLANIFTRGKKYHITIDVDSVICAFPSYDTPELTLEIFVGYISTSKSQFRLHNGDSGTYELDLWCQEDSPFIMRAAAENDALSGVLNKILINSVSIKSYDWNAPLTYDPPIDFDVKIETSAIYHEAKINSISEVVYYDDGYTYLSSLPINSKCDVKIEYSSDGITWTNFYEGIIYLNEATFDRESVTTDIESVIEESVRKGKAQKLRLDGLINDKLRLRHYNNPSIEFIQFHDIGSGLYYTGVFVYNVFKAFRDLVYEYSDCRVGFKSDDHYTNNAGWFDNIGIMIGSGILDNLYISGHRASIIYIEKSIEDLYKLIDSIFNIAMYEYYDGTINFVRIENISTLWTAFWHIPINYTDVNNIRRQYNDKYACGVFKGGYKIGWNYENDATDIWNATNNISEKITEYVIEEVRDSTLLYNALTAAPTTESDGKYFLVEYDGGTQMSIDFGANCDNVLHAYNCDIQSYNNANRHTDILYFTYLHATQIGQYTITGINTKIMEYEFEYSISVANFMILRNDPYTIINLINSYINSAGNLYEISWNVLTNIATIKLLGT